MTRTVRIIRTDRDRADIASWARGAPVGTRVEFKEAKRTLPQNDRLWAMLSDVAQQVTYHGMKMPASDWKYLFLDALKREMRLIPNLEGTGMVQLGRSSSDLSKEEMSDLMEIIAEWGARNGVTFHERSEAA